MSERTATTPTAGMDIVSRLRASTGFTLADEAADEIEHLRAFVLLMDEIAYLDHDDIMRLHGKYAAIPGMADAVQRAFDSGSEAPDDNPHESDGTTPEACAYCGDVWPCAGADHA